MTSLCLKQPVSPRQKDGISFTTFACSGLQAFGLCSCSSPAWWAPIIFPLMGLTRAFLSCTAPAFSSTVGVCFPYSRCPGPRIQLSHRELVYWFWVQFLRVSVPSVQGAPQVTPNWQENNNTIRSNNHSSEQTCFEW